MVIIPKRNYRICLYCGHIFKKEEMKESYSLSEGGIYPVCPNCSNHANKTISGEKLDKLTGRFYFNIIQSINNKSYKDYDSIYSDYMKYNIPKSLWYFGDYAN